MKEKLNNLSTRAKILFGAAVLGKLAKFALLLFLLKD